MKIYEGGLFGRENKRRETKVSRRLLYVFKNPDF